MTQSAPPGAGRSREERLAAKLRENLKRRKVQDRALNEEGSVPPPLSKPTGRR